MNQAEEDLLVISARAGSEEAFGFLFRHYHKPLLRKSRATDATRDGEVPETADDGGLANRVNAAELHGLMSRLPEIERQVLHLFYLDEMKISEIAAVLEVPPGTVKSRLSRARGQLRELYQRTTGESYEH